MVQSDEREEVAGIEAEVAPLEEPQKVKGKATKKKKPPAPPPGKFQRFLRKVLLWAVGLLGVFALGVGVTWVMLVRDLRTENADLQSQVEALEAGQVAAQESIRQEYQDQLDAFQAEVEEANTEKQRPTILVVALKDLEKLASELILVRPETAIRWRKRRFRVFVEYDLVPQADLRHRENWA